MKDQIYLRAGLVVVQEGKILLVPHFNTEDGPVKWVIPGGGVLFGGELQSAALREFQEETGFVAEIDELLEVYEVIKPEQPWHSVSLWYSGHIVGGELQPEWTPWGPRKAQWLSLSELAGQPHHPPEIISKALRQHD